MIKYRKLNLIETNLLLINISLIWFFYIPIGSLSSFKNVNYAPLITLTYDYHFHFYPILTIPYILAFVFPVLSLIYLIVKEYPKKQPEIAYYFNSFLIIIVSFTIYYLFPTNVSVNLGLNTNISPRSPLDYLVKFNYSILSPWNSFPSMHISIPWLIFNLLFSNRISKWFLGVYLSWFVLMIWSTLSLKLHTIIDVSAGLILTQAIYFFWLQCQKKIMKWYKEKSIRKRINFWMLTNIFLLLLICISKYFGLFEVTIKV